MRFHAIHVSTTVSGDYYQALFEESEDSSDGADGPYLLIQRQFEMPDDDECYVETHNEEYIGHFHLRSVDFSANGISIEIDRANNGRIDVTLAMTPDEYASALPIIKLITEQSA